MNKQKYVKLFIGLMFGILSLAACTNTQTTLDNMDKNTPDLKKYSDMFTDQDMESGYEEETSTVLTLEDDATLENTDNVTIIDDTITITEEGTYILRGALTNGQVVIDADKSAKIQVVLDNAEITNTSTAPIYVKKAEKVFITLANDSENLLSVAGEFVAIDDNNIDAAIFSKKDLTINGNGTLIIENPYGNGITSKDNLIITNGNYDIDVSGHGLEGKDSVRVANGIFNIMAVKDGVHASNKDDLSLGYIYIADGTFEITSSDDGMHADSDLVITNGTVDIIESYEGLEGKTVQINDGLISIVSSDDGINAAEGNLSEETTEVPENEAINEDVYIKITGGEIHVDAEGDGIDSNGNFYVTGGELYISGPQSNGDGAIDYDGTAVISGGVVVAAGMSGMAENFDEDSTQGSMLVSSENVQTGEIHLTDSNGTEILSYSPSKSYNSVVISTSEIKKDETYTITMGSETQEIEMTTLIYGQGGMRGQGPNNGKMPEHPEGEEMPERPEGEEIPENSEEKEV